MLWEYPPKTFAERHVVGDCRDDTTPRHVTLTCCGYAALTLSSFWRVYPALGGYVMYIYNIWYSHLTTVSKSLKVFLFTTSMYQSILILTFVETLHLEKVEDKSNLFLKSVFLVVSLEQQIFPERLQVSNFISFRQLSAPSFAAVPA